MTTLINVCGAGRSGTTMIDLMLGNAKDAFSCGEVYAWFRPWRNHHFQIDCSCSQNNCPIWDGIKKYSENIFHKRLFEEFNLNYVVDSSKDLLWVVDNNNWAAQNNMAIINLLVWKDPINLAHSHWKRKQGANAWRKVFVNYYIKFFQTNLPFVSLSYNELAQNPSEKLKQLCKIVGMEYFPGKERFWEKPHHFLYGSGGIRRQIQQGMSEIKSHESYPLEFTEIMPSLSKKIQVDDQIQEILSCLWQSEVSQYSSTMSTLYKNNSLPDAKRPLWYYTSWLKRIYRKHFPHHYLKQVGES